MSSPFTTRNIIRAIGRRASSTRCATTFASRTITAASRTATCRRSRACAVRKASGHGAKTRLCPAFQPIEIRARRAVERANGKRGLTMKSPSRLECRYVAHTLAFAALCLSMAIAPVSAQTPAKNDVPNLASKSFAWLSGADWFDPPPGAGRGPIRQDPDYPFVGNVGAKGRQVTVRLGNYKDSVLKPWAAKEMRESNEEVISGKRAVGFAAQARCYPGGVPGQLLYPAEPMYFIQTPKEVWMIWQRDHMVRRVYMTDKHSDNVKPSWFGESIGRYENGELVVDTVSLSTRNSYIDNLRTPHTEKEHVVERFKLSADGNALEAQVLVEDPDTFNEPLHMMQRWRKVRNPLLETVCAENNVDHFHQNLFPLPEADKPDF